MTIRKPGLMRGNHTFLVFDNQADALAKMPTADISDTEMAFAGVVGGMTEILHREFSISEEEYCWRFRCIAFFRDHPDFEEPPTPKELAEQLAAAKAEIERLRSEKDLLVGARAYDIDCRAAAIRRAVYAEAQLATVRASREESEAGRQYWMREALGRETEGDARDIEMRRLVAEREAALAKLKGKPPDDAGGAELAEAIDIIASMVNQHCSTREENGETVVCSDCLSANSEAMDFLDTHGRMEEIRSLGRAVISRWKEMT